MSSLIEVAKAAYAAQLAEQERARRGTEVTITFEPSQVFTDCYHAMYGGKAVGMVIKQDARWSAQAYRPIPTDDLRGSFVERRTAEDFIRANAYTGR